MAQNTQIRRLIIVSTLSVILVGGFLSAVSLLPIAAQSTLSQGTGLVSSTPLSYGFAVTREQPMSQLLPTIPRPTSADSSPQPIANSDVRNSANKFGSPFSEDTSLAERVTEHLECLQGEAQHNPMLDEEAAALTKEEHQLLPLSGVVQVGGHGIQRFLLAPDVVADLQIPHARCGETLIFGIPPIDWLPPNTEFGIGLDKRQEGAVIIIVVQES